MNTSERPIISTGLHLIRLNLFSVLWRIKLHLKGAIQCCSTRVCQSDKLGVGTYCS